MNNDLREIYPEKVRRNTRYATEELREKFATTLVVDRCREEMKDGTGKRRQPSLIYEALVTSCKKGKMQKQAMQNDKRTQRKKRGIMKEKKNSENQETDDQYRRRIGLCDNFTEPKQLFLRTTRGSFNTKTTTEMVQFSLVYLVAGESRKCRGGLKIIIAR